MSIDPEELSGPEQAVLLVLMAEARPVANTELPGLGPALDKPTRDRLIHRGLLETNTAVRPMEHELTDLGWATCARLFGAAAPLGSKPQGKALYTVLRALRRYFDRDDLAPGDVFIPLDVGPPAGAPEPLGDTVEASVHAAYVRLAARAGGWVDLVRLRADLPEVSKPELDAALARMYRDPRVSLIPEENQKTLTDADRAAAVLIGEQHKHLIAIES